MQKAETAGAQRPGGSTTAPTDDPHDTDRRAFGHGLRAALGVPGVVAVDPTPPGPLAELLELLDFRGDEFVAVCHQPPGGQFAYAVMPPSAAPAYTVGLGDAQDVWFSVNPTRGPARVGGGRGTAVDTTRVAALYADLDHKPAGCRDQTTAEAIVSEVSGVLGTRPSVIIHTGHGQQPYWPLDDGDVAETFTIADAKSLQSRFGRLVAAVAHHHNAAVDNVSDLARVLRVPGTMNVKGVPVPVIAAPDTGGPLSVSEADERMAEVGIDRQLDDAADVAVMSDPGAWMFAPASCSYVTAIIDGIASDGPRNGGGRNPWLCSQAVRLCCAWRRGCISESDFRRAITELETRLAALLATTEPRRALRRYELRDALTLGQRRASEKTDDAVWAELGRHGHHDPLDPLGTGMPVVANGSLGPTGEHPAAEVSPSSAAEVAAVPLYADQVLSRSALRELPPPEPLIDGVLDRGTCALLYGYRGSYKSFIAFDWAASVATKRPWQGRATVPLRGLYVAAEGAHGYPGRFDAWETGWNRPIADGALDLLPRPVNFMSAPEVGNLGALIEWGAYGFIVIDTTARCLVGGDENSARDMGMFVDRLYWLLDRTPDRRGVVLAVHHTGKDKTTLRGSSALDAGVDTVYSVVRDGPVATLNREKRKDGPELDHHELMLDPIPGTGSCALKAAHDPVPGGPGTRETTAKLRSIVSQHFAATGASATTLRDFVLEGNVMAKTSFYRALNELVQSAYLVNTGTDSRPHYMVNQ